MIRDEIVESTRNLGLNGKFGFISKMNNKVFRSVCYNRSSAFQMVYDFVWNESMVAISFYEAIRTKMNRREF